MKKHNGMRPQDIVVLLKIATYKDKKWLMKDLANDLYISPSEISESITRNVYAGLLASDKKRIMKLALIDFLIFGFKYAFPQKPNAMVRGMLTAHNAPPLHSLIQNSSQYVWPYSEGQDRGFAIVPLHKNVPKACLKDKHLYELLALLDAIRLGSVREQKLATEALKERIL